VSAFVTVSHATGGQTSYPAVFDGTQWVATGLVVNDTDTVLVAPGDLSDQVGNINGGPLVLWEPPLDDGR
jgi:hypothetical protein